MDDEYYESLDSIDEYEFFQDCEKFGDDHYKNENGEVVSYCPDCIYYSYREIRETLKEE